MKIKIDLCKLFGVEEGQEFEIDDSKKKWRTKYKIENNILYCFANDGMDGWVISAYNLLWLGQEHEIEILKPETPHEIEKILKELYNLGLRCFYVEDLDYCVFEDNSDDLTNENNFLQFKIHHPVLESWIKTLMKVPNNIYYIEDFI